MILWSRWGWAPSTRRSLGAGGLWTQRPSHAPWLQTTSSWRKDPRLYMDECLYRTIHLTYLPTYLPANLYIVHLSNYTWYNSRCCYQSIRIEFHLIMITEFYSFLFVSGVFLIGVGMRSARPLRWCRAIGSINISQVGWMRTTSYFAPHHFLRS